MTGPIPVLVLLRMLNSLSVQELQHIYGLMALRLPWVLVVGDPCDAGQTAYAV